MKWILDKLKNTFIKKLNVNIEYDVQHKLLLYFNDNGVVMTKLKGYKFLLKNEKCINTDKLSSALIKKCTVCHVYTIKRSKKLYKKNKKCSQCQQTFYCGVKHQAIDWKQGHKKICTPK